LRSELYTEVEDTVKNEEAWSHSSREWNQVDARWMWGGYREEGPNRKNNTLIICLSALLQFWT